MQQRLVVWGDIGTDRKALVAIELEDGGTTVCFRALPEEDVAPEVQDQLFTVWKNGGEYAFPEDVPTWRMDAGLENIVPEGIHLHKPEMLVSAQRQWTKIRNIEANFRLMNDKTHLLEQKLGGIKEFDQELWKETKALWEEITGLKSSGDISWTQSDELKLRINAIFDGLKAFRRINKERNHEESTALFRLFDKQVDDCIAELIYPNEWGKITERLKQVQKDMQKAPLSFKHIRELRKKIDGAFQSLRSYRQSDHVRHMQDRIANLTKIIRKLNESMVHDKTAYEHQFEKMKHYTRGKMSDDEIAAQLSYLKTRNKEKEKKIADFEKTIRSLEAKIRKIEEGGPDTAQAARKKKRRKKRKNPEAGSGEKAKEPSSKKVVAPDKENGIPAPEPPPKKSAAATAKKVAAPDLKTEVPAPGPLPKKGAAVSDSKGQEPSADDADTTASDASPKGVEPPSSGPGPEKAQKPSKGAGDKKVAGPDLKTEVPAPGPLPKKGAAVSGKKIQADPPAKKIAAVSDPELSSEEVDMAVPGADTDVAKKAAAKPAGKKTGKKAEQPTDKEKARPAKAKTNADKAAPEDDATVDTPSAPDPSE